MDSFGVSTVSFDAPSWFGNSQFEEIANKPRRRKPKYILSRDTWMMEPPETTRDYETHPVQHSCPRQFDFTHNRTYGGKQTAGSSKHPQASIRTEHWPESAREVRHKASDMSLLSSAVHGSWGGPRLAAQQLQAPTETPRRALVCPDAYAPIPRVTASNWRSTLPRLAKAAHLQADYGATLGARAMPAAMSSQRASQDTTAGCLRLQGGAPSARTGSARPGASARTWRTGSLSSRRTRTPGR